MDLQDFIALYGLKETSYEKGSMDSMVRSFAGPDLLLKYVRDRGIDDFDAASVLDSQAWFHIPLVQALIEKIEATEKRTPIEVQKEFLLKHAPKIKEVFSLKAYPENKAKLIRLQNDRAKRMFPELY